MMKRYLILISILGVTAGLFLSTAYGQAPPMADDGPVLLKYSKLLHDEMARHLQVVESLYNKLVGILAASVIILGSIFTWMQWRTKKEVTEQVNNRIDALAKNAIDDKVKEFGNEVQRLRDDLERQVKELKSTWTDQVRDINVAMFSPTIPPSSDISARPVPETRKILWVDDIPSNNDVPAEILRNSGVQITSVLTTQAAMDALSSQSFDLIISDMARGSDKTAGLDLLRELSDRRIKAPAIIFCGAYSAKRYGDEARKYGAVAITSGVTTLLNTAFSVLGLRNQQNVK